jgi:asparagine synthase (glutamine-hydrolysing)
MCGICGFYNYSTGEPADEQLIRAMTARIRHRGPDDEGLYVDGPLAIGMRRLSIIDVQGGHQPIHNEDKMIWVSFNGEIYNFLELRQELEARGHAFYTRSDTEVIVHSYEEWGDDCVLHINGIFGFAIWDSCRQRLLLARDHFGVKPLYYYDDGKRLLWASEAKALLEDASVPREVDTEALNLFLTFRYVPSPFTMFKGIRKLPSGHRLIMDSRGCRMERYWHPRPQGNGALSEQDYVTLLQERLEAAVRRQMISDVPVGALLSGGIDSAAVVAIMSELTDHPVRTFTVGFKDANDINELKEARATAVLFGTEHREVVLDSLNYQQWLQQATWHMDEPVCTTSALAMSFVCELAREHVKVVLTGQGADEPHAGYHRYLGERYGLLYRWLPEPFRERVVRPLIEILPRQERIKRAVRSLGTRDATKRFAQIYAVFSEEMKTALWQPELRPGVSNDAVLKVINYWRQGIDHLDPLVQMAYVDARLELADDLLMYGDKMSMANSVEARVPFLDLEYMAVAEALPASLRIRGLTHKYIHKKAIEKWLPQDIICRPKKGFDTPVDRWFRSELAGYVRYTLLAPSSACNIYFNPDTIDSMLCDHIKGRQDHRRQLFSLLVFELWHRQFISGVKTGVP